MVSHGVFTIVDISDGAQWYSGVNITEKSTTPTIFLNSGITYAVEGDMYLNTSTQNTYRCVESGDSSSAKWVYVNNIKGDTGKGISSIKSQYYLHTSDTNRPADNVNWEDAPPNYQENYYYWIRSYITWSDGSSPTTTIPVLDMALTNANKNAVEAKEEAEEAAKVATNYLSVDETGIMIADMEYGEQTPSAATSRNVFIDNNSVDIRDGQKTLASFRGEDTKFYDVNFNNKEVASFGSNGVRVGNEDEQHFIVDAESIQAINENGSPIFSVTSTGGTITSDVIVAKGFNSQMSNYDVVLNGGISTSKNTFFPKYLFVLIDIQNSRNEFTSFVVSIDDGEFEDVPFTRTTYTPEDSRSVVYSRHRVDLPPFLFHYGTSKRISYQLEGVYTSDKGNTYRYSGDFHISYDGQRTITMEPYQDYFLKQSGDAEDDTKKTNFNAYLWGDICSSLGYTKAPAMTFGTRGNAGTIAPLSVTIGQDLYANNENQLSIGRYNLNNDELFPLAFAIGNGVDDTNRSNAFNVDWDGNTEVAGALNVSGQMKAGGNPLFKLVTKTIPYVHIDKNSGQYPSVKVDEEGYTPVAISCITLSGVGGSSYSYCIVNSTNIDGDYLRFYVGNWNQSYGISIKMDIKVLCIATSALKTS